MDFPHEKRLLEEMKSGSSLIYIHGPSRSGTTISEISIGQAADLTFSQPFTSAVYSHTGKKSGIISDALYEEACQNLYEAIQKTKQDLNKTSITVVVKEVNGRLPDHLFQRWMNIPDHTLIAIRDPHVQLMSMMRQHAMSNFSLEKRPTQEEVLHKYACMLESTLTNDGTGRTFLQFNEDKWISLEQDIQMLDTMKKPYTIFDTTLMRHNPIKSLQAIFEAAGLDTKNIGNSTSGFKTRDFRFIDTMDKDRSATQKAYASNELLPLDNNESIPTSVFPEASRESLKRILPIYLNLLASTHMAYLPSTQEMSEPSWGTAPGSSLVATHPFTAYAVAKIHAQQFPSVLKDIQDLKIGDKRFAELYVTDSSSEAEKHPLKRSAYKTPKPR